MNASKRQIFLILLMSSLLFLIATGCGLFYPLYAGGPYKGRVIDSETKQPLEGAVVLAVWDSVFPGVSGDVTSYLDAQEVLTDRDGRFVVGKHPPISWRPGWVEGPRITIFCPGYGFYPRCHASPAVPLGGTEELLERMEKEELTIELPRLTREERLYSIHDIDDPDVPNEKKRNLLRIRNMERKALGLPGDNEYGNVDGIIIIGFPDEKTLDRLRLQYKQILIKKNGRYFNLDGTPTGKVYEGDLPTWARELLWRIKYAFSLYPLLSEKTNVLEENDYLPFCINGKGSLIRIPDPVTKMHEFFRSNGWKANDRYAAHEHGSSSFAYEKERYHCRILVEIDEVGTIPRRFGFEIYCREKGQK